MHALLQGSQMCLLPKEIHMVLQGTQMVMHTLLQATQIQGNEM